MLLTLSGRSFIKKITDGVHDLSIFHRKKHILFISIFHRKKKLFCLFHTFNPFWEKLYQNPVQFFSVIPLPHSNALQYHVKREKCKVNDIIFPSGCEAHAINLGNKNMKISIFTGGTSVRSKIFSLIFLNILPESMK